MDIQVAEHLAALLYEHDTLILPGFGAFVTQVEAAALDAVQGRIEVPTKTVTFNPNLVLDDGRLVGQLQKIYAVSPSAARDAVDQYLDGLRATIEKGDIAEIPEIGRIYQDYEKQWRFLPEDNNFDKNSYGLPGLNYYPLARNERPTTVQATETTTPPPPVTTTAKTKTAGFDLMAWLQENLSWVAAVSLVVLAMVIYFAFFRQSSIDNNSATAELPQDRINIPPPSTDEMEDYDPLADEEEELPNDTEIIGPDTEEVEDTEAPTLAPDQKSAVIAVGLFGSEKNVERMIKKVYDLGFEPYTGREGDLTRVGVRVAYEEDAELARVLRSVKRKLEQSAFVMEGVE